MKIAMLAPIAWRTPPRHYGPWESVVSLLTEGLLAEGVSVTLFATGDSETSGKLAAVCPRGYEEDRSVDAGVWSCLHISEVFERASEFDLIHNHFDFRPLAYSRLVSTPLLTTIHGFSSEKILPVYQKYDAGTNYVSISDADRSPALTYARTIHHGIDLSQFQFSSAHDDYLLFFGRIHPDKGAAEAIQIAALTGCPLVIAGIIQDAEYFRVHVEPHLDNDRVRFVGSVGPEERSRILGRAQALLHPIFFDEPFGLSVVEAMACGTPVIAFDRGSMPELIRDGETGYLIPAPPAAAPEKAIEAAAKKVGLLNLISRARCREHVEDKFPVQRMVKEYTETYENILARQGQRHERNAAI